MKQIKKLTSFLLVIALLVGVGIHANAATAKLSLSGVTSVTVGKTFTVKATLSAANVASFTGKVSFDSAKLTCTAATISTGNPMVQINKDNVVATWTNVNGQSSVVITLTFKAIATGSVKISFGVYDCYDSAFQEITVSSSASSTVKINAVSSSASQSSSKPSQSSSKTSQSSKPSQSSSKPSSQAPSSSEQSSQPEIPPAPIQITVNGADKQVVTSLVGIEIPRDFEIRQDEYMGQTVDVATGINEEIMLMYLTDLDGTNGAFYQYIRSQNAFYPFLRIQIDAKSYSIVPMPESLILPAGWTEATVSYGGRQIPVLSSEDEAYHGYYLVYASNAKGEVNFYLFDTEDETLQRYILPSGDVQTNTPAESGNNVFERILADREIFLIVLTAITLAVLVGAAWLLVHVTRSHSVVSHKKRKAKEEKIARKLEKRAKRAAGKNQVERQKPEISSFETGEIE